MTVLSISRQETHFHTMLSISRQENLHRHSVEPTRFQLQQAVPPIFWKNSEVMNTPSKYPESFPVQIELSFLEGQT